MEHDFTVYPNGTTVPVYKAQPQPPNDTPTLSGWKMFATVLVIFGILGTVFDNPSVWGAGILFAVLFWVMSLDGNKPNTGNRDRFLFPWGT